MVFSMGRYDHLSEDELRRMLERRDASRRLGLVWEREHLDRETVVNEDFVALTLDRELSTPPAEDGAWRNLLIEGDNWDALRTLRLTHAGRVKCILIDPPYNTGNSDFIYNDRFVGREDRFRQSMWLEFLYRRLLLARDLLREDGVLLVCINDEQRGLLDLLLQQALPGMRVGSFVWRTKDTNNSDKRRNWSGVHEHVMIYAREGFSFIGPEAGPGKFRLREGFGNTPVRFDPITKAGTFRSRANTYYPVQNPATGLWYPCAPNQVWRFWSEEVVQRDAAAPSDGPVTGRRRRAARAGTGPSMESLIAAGLIHFPKEDKEPFLFETRQALDEAIATGSVPRDGKGRPLLVPGLPRLEEWVGRRIAHSRLSRIVYRTPEDDEARKPVGSWIGGLSEETGDDAPWMLRSDRQGAGTTEIERIFGTQAFSFPKPSSLITALVRVVTQEGDTVLDFFAGSGTTGAAVLALNDEDDGDRRFIMVSSTEATPDDPDKNLCRDVCAERLRRALVGYGGGQPLAGDFAYLRTQRIPWDDVVYDLTPQQTWTLLQLRHDRDLRPFDGSSDVQISDAPVGGDEPVLIYTPVWTCAAEAKVRMLAKQERLVVFSPAPAAVASALRMPYVTIEAAPGRLLEDFPQKVAGL